MYYFAHEHEVYATREIIIDFVYFVIQYFQGNMVKIPIFGKYIAVRTNECPPFLADRCDPV